MINDKKILILLAAAAMAGVGCKNNSTSSPNPAHPLLFQIGSYGSAQGQFRAPAGIDVDSADNIYVADYGNERVQKLDSSGNFLQDWGPSNDTVIQPISEPQGLVIDAADNIFVVDLAPVKILKLTTAGALTTSWGTSGVGVGQFEVPHWTALAPSGSVYVTDTGAYRVEYFDNAGNNPAVFGQFGNGPAIGDFNVPGGIAVDSTGNVYVGDTGTRRIEIFTAVGAPVTAWSTGVYAIGGGMKFDASGNLWAVDTDSRAILEFNSSGSWISTWNDPAGLAQPDDVAFDSKGAMWVSYQYPTDSFLIKYAH